MSLQFESSCQASATLPEQCDGAASIALGGATVHGRSRRLFAIFENYLANGSPGKSAAKPVVIYAKNYALFVSAGSHQSQRPSDKRCGSSHWGPGDVDRYLDSKSALELSRDPTHFKLTKHILRHAYELRDRVARRVYSPEFVESSGQLADVLTKALRPGLHWAIVPMLLRQGPP